MKRLKYVSRFAHPITEPEIRELVEKAAARNAELDLTGILMTTGEMFFQVLEGPAEQVDEVFRAIRADPRHTDVLLLSLEDDVAHRIFPDWSMKRMSLGAESSTRLEPVREILEAVVDLRFRAEKLANALERAIWRELSGK
ncbi:MAG: BLUF domain-containing protein [Polyangia bacterium]|jgi:hypothetical protein|nr:BLUF domain-containing protein [Polyangia bacterium]